MYTESGLSQVPRNSQGPPGAVGDLAAGSQEVSSIRNRSELHDPSTQPQPLTLPRRQDTATPRQEIRSPTPSSHRTLRRTPRFSASPSPRPSPTPQRRVHIEAVTVGISPPPIFSLPHSSDGLRGTENVFSPLRQELSQDLTDEEEDEEGASIFLRSSSLRHHQRFASSTRDTIHPTVRLSRHTKSAILWTLEEALRKPNPFTPDWIEENESMADLIAGANSGSGPATTNGNGATTSRPTASASQTGSPQQIRGPRMIMRERAEREARQKAEREQVERARAEEEARLLEEARRRAERRQPSSGAAQGSTDIPSDPAAYRRHQRAQSEAQAGSSRYHQTPSGQQQSAVPQPLRTARQTSSPTHQPATITAGPSAPSQQGESSTAPGNASTRLKNTFPHAFERWEALSAHWEGMTSFWLRRLQENTDEAERNPISSQLSRQVADLSAAGANLFHAVVELQRLRASSERKFQRWFFETRAELERNQEIAAMLETQLEQERQARADQTQNFAKLEAENAKNQKLISEMRRELLISKEEARRAWEELGRREQEERDRTVSLQQGLPTIVGGVQVVPMTQGPPSREPSRRERSHAQGTDTSNYVAAQPGQYPGYGQPSSQSNSGREPQFAPESDLTGYSEEDNLSYIDQPSTAQPGTNYPPSSSQWSQTYQGNPEYSGQGYTAPGWESMARHQHPTRLSDVLEEDERSRTSASQLSRP
ncbi:hypothetical protein QBC38DRAFT_439148 [Podospora fimiseda]|uniref:Uncharacterized protein n=1 Tax=Podospora fimiseda TaxID=252190 RepID=A0AAN7H4Z3_9PEZI|nr:hypothetical protein QBC38DRAFT_439148 [Podospora fimiseda]